MIKITSWEPVTAAVIRTPGATWGNLIVESVSGLWRCGDVTDGISVRTERGCRAGFVMSVADLRRVLELVDREQDRIPTDPGPTDRSATEKQEE